MKIGIYGGSFNPPHMQHEQIAKSLVKLSYVDNVILVPASGQYVKGGLLPFNCRFEMLSRVFENDAHIEVSNMEEKFSFKTLQVMDYFQRENPSAELYYILGADNLDELDTWYEYSTLLAKYKILVIERDGIDCESIVRLKYQQYASHIVFANVPARSISASNVRQEILKNGFSNSVRSMISPIVVEELQKIDYRKYWI